MDCFVREVVICKKIGHGLFRARSGDLYRARSGDL